MAIFYGMNPPFLGGSQNVLSRQEDQQLIQNDILQFLLTMPGERVMRPNFGVNLRSFIFEQITDDNLALLENEISQGLNAEEPRITILNINITKSPESHGIHIVIIYRIKKDPLKEISFDRFIKLN